MQDGYQQITDFAVGDIVRRSRYSYHDSALGGPVTKHRVTAVHPGDNGTHEVPDRVGSLEIEGADGLFGHLLFDVPLIEDNPTIESLQEDLAEMTAERDAAQWAMRAALESYEAARETLIGERQQAEQYAAMRRERTDALEGELAAHKALRAFVEEHVLDEDQTALAIGFTHGYVAADRA